DRPTAPAAPAAQTSPPAQDGPADQAPSRRGLTAEELRYLRNPGVAEAVVTDPRRFAAGEAQPTRRPTTQQTEPHGPARADQLWRRLMAEASESAARRGLVFEDARLWVNQRVAEDLNEARSRFPDWAGPQAPLPDLVSYEDQLRDGYWSIVVGE